MAQVIWTPTNTDLWEEYLRLVAQKIQVLKDTHGEKVARTVLYALNVVAVLDCVRCQEQAVNGVFEIHTDLSGDPSVEEILRSNFKELSDLRDQYMTRWNYEPTGPQEGNGASPA